MRSRWTSKIEPTSGSEDSAACDSARPFVAAASASESRRSSAGTAAGATGRRSTSAAKGTASWWTARPTRLPPDTGMPWRFFTLGAYPPSRVVAQGREERLDRVRGGRRVGPLGRELEAGAARGREVEEVHQVLR